jgi:hypothetical protein
MTNYNTRPATLVRRKTTSMVEAPRINYSSSRSEAGAPCSVAFPGSPGFQKIAFPGSEGLCHLGIKEEEDTDTDSELEWGVQENMRLFEVSAKDDQGLQIITGVRYIL